MNTKLISTFALITPNSKKNMEIEIKNSNLDALTATGKPMVIDFYATWCGPCKKIAPMIEELAEQYDGQIVVGKCDVDENDELAAKFGIRNIPTVLFFKGGELVDKHVGAATKSFFEDKFKALL